MGAATFASRRSPRALLGCAIAVGLALGTKVTGVLLATAVAPWILLGLWREPAAGRLGRNLRRSVVAAGVFLATGGGLYLMNLIRSGHVLEQPTRVTHGGYGDWANLWKFPILLFMSPWSSSPNGVQAPWDGRLWFWQRYDLYSSNLGALCTVLVLALPIAVWRVRRMAVAPEQARERTVASIAALSAFALIAPVRLVPEGFFCTFSRFVIFVVPVIAAWTVVPAVAALGRRAPMLGTAALALLASAFAAQALLCVEHDIYAPLSWVEHEVEAPDGLARFSRGRACTAVDHLARPTDVVAIDSDFDAWIYPCWGRRWTRTVKLLSGTNPADIPLDARWVAIDRSWGVTWNHPGFTDFGHFFDMIHKGTPTPEETALGDALAHDPRFRLVFENRKLNQVVYERI
jgi:hypothetical protein